MKTVIFGGTGFVGKRLQSLLVEDGYSVRVRDIRRDSDWKKEVAESDAVINLAGFPLFKKRWNDSVKAEIHRSRVEGTRKIVQAIGEIKKSGAKGPELLLNASAIGYYPLSENDTFNEQSGSGGSFLSFVCREWEEEVWAAENRFGVRSAVLRLGVVLGKNGGALDQIVPPFKLFAGGPIGNGKQWMSWVHIEDVCRLFMHLLKNKELRGVFNAVSPNPVRYGHFASTLGKVLGRPSLLPMPKLGMRALVGEASSVITGSQRVLPQKTLESGFEFRYPDLQKALKDILKK